VPHRRSAVTSPSRSSSQPVRGRAVAAGEVDERLERVESLLREILQTIATNGKRLTALQAQLDHLSAKSRNV